MGFDKRCTSCIKFRTKQPFDSRDVKAAILAVGMVAVDRESEGRKRRDDGKREGSVVTWPRPRRTTEIIEIEDRRFPRLSIRHDDTIDLCLRIERN